MIEFQDPLDRMSLVNKIKNQIQLIQALANFHIHVKDERYADDLTNQRDQLVKSLKELGTAFDIFLESEDAPPEDFKVDRNGEQEQVENMDLISQFIQACLPEEMATRWDPQKFTGSLLVFFRQGKIESGSLIEKKASVEQENIVNDFPENLQGKEDSAEEKLQEDPVQVVSDQEDSFTILKSPDDSNIHFYFSLLESSPVAMRIFNQSEQLVRQIDKFYDRPGDYIIVWDGLDNQGNEVRKEKYNCQLRIGETDHELRSIDLS